MAKLNVFYTHKQNVRDNNSFSPSAGKPDHVVKQFVRSGKVDVTDGWMPLTQE